MLWFTRFFSIRSVSNVFTRLQYLHKQCSHMFFNTFIILESIYWISMILVILSRVSTIFGDFQWILNDFLWFSKDFQSRTLTWPAPPTTTKFHSSCHPASPLSWQSLLAIWSLSLGSRTTSATSRSTTSSWTKLEKESTWVTWWKISPLLLLQV